MEIPQTPSIFIAPYKCISAHLRIQMINKVVQLNQREVAVKTLSFAKTANTTCSATETIQNFILGLFRKYGLHKNEREMVLCDNDQLVAVQLSLANNNKQVIGDFDIEASKVIATNKQLTSFKLANALGNKHEQPSTEFQEFLIEYEKFLETNNVTDWMDVCDRITEEVPKNDELKRSLSEKHYLLLGKPTGEIEKTLLHILVKDKSVHSVKAELPLDQSFTEKSEDFCPEVVIQSCQPEDISTPMDLDVSSSQPKSITEMYIERVLTDYLHLLVNSRNEMSLARVINLPTRGLGHTAFTHLKHDANRKGMSMFQTAVSYIMRLRLGGKSYAPDPHSKLSAYVKGLGEFVDLMHKLQTIIEEDTDIRSAVKRPINILKNTILKSTDNLIRPQSVTVVAERLHELTGIVGDEMEKSLKDSPPKTASAGGSQVGRQALRVMRGLLDFQCAQPSAMHTVDVLSDAFSSQGTPIRFPSLMSKFRSPLEYSPNELEKKSLAERMNQKHKPKAKVSGMPRYQANHDWAQPSHNVGMKNSENNLPVIEDFIPSKTLVHAGRGLNKDQEKSAWSRPLARRVLESIADQENVPHTGRQFHEGSDSACTNTISTSHKEFKKATKRTFGELGDERSSSQAVNAKRQKKAQPKGNNRKVLPLQKGQKQLTAFFRV